MANSSIQTNIQEVLMNESTFTEPLQMIAGFIDIFAILKIILIVFMLGYLIVSAVVLKQIYMMTDTIKSETNSLIIMLGYINLFLGLIIFLLVLLIH